MAPVIAAPINSKQNKSLNVIEVHNFLYVALLVDSIAHRAGAGPPLRKLGPPLYF